jgi:glycosyltransferase involved in cell wall biosynthesis
VISVVVPTRNRAELCRRAVESVLWQTCQDWECIVIDDGGSDGTREMLPDDPRIRYLWQEHRGANAARNAGIAEARGEYVAFLDSDDVYLPRYLELQLRTFERKPALGMAYCWATWKHDGYVYDRCGRYEGREIYRAALGGTFSPAMSTIMARRDALIGVGCFDEQITAHADRELVVRLAAKFPATYTPAILVEGDVSGSDRISRPGPELRKALVNFYTKHLDSLKAERLEARFLNSACRQYLFTKNDRGGLQAWADALRELRSPWGYLYPLLAMAPWKLRRQVPRWLRTVRQVRGKEASPAIWSVRCE